MNRVYAQFSNWSDKSLGEIACNIMYVASFGNAEF